MMDRQKLEKKKQKFIDCILFIGLIVAIVLLIYDCLKSHKAEETNFMTLNQSEWVREYQLGEKKIILDCIADGNPKPSIKWSHNGNEIDWSSDKKFHLLNGSLAIINFSSNDSGTYYCQASNGFQTKTIEYIILLTPFSEIIDENLLNTSTRDFIKQYSSEWRTIFDDTYLTCSITGIETPKITWYHNDTAIDFSNKNKFILGNGDLKIIDISFKDAGSYKCEASNEFGNLSHKYNLEVFPSSEKYNWLSRESYKANPTNYKLVKLDPTFQVEDKNDDEYYLGRYDVDQFYPAIVSLRTKICYCDIETTAYKLLEIYGDYKWQSVINGTIPSGAIYEQYGNEYIYIGKIKRDNNYSVIINVHKNDTSVYYYPSSDYSRKQRRYDNNFEILVVI